MAPIIRTQGLRKVYAVGTERVVALNDVNISVEKGEFCCIVGQSGSGKSTLLNQLAGLEKPTRGKVFIGKHEISAMTENELAAFRQAHLGFIFQSYNLLPSMTAAENVALPLMFKGMGRRKRMALARQELKNMGLASRMNHLPTEMSGGQQQRVGIARAFVSKPKVIFADEPTGNLDSKTSRQVLLRMLEMSKKDQITFVMVTHEPSLAACADRIITILDGRVQSDVVQPEDVKEKNRAELAAQLKQIEAEEAAAKAAKETAKAVKKAIAGQA
ncbi:ABC transporter ATP-binding protein [uncultured Gemmiger sp.]|uniref:ABC transporter ATP-binding protein n=1 Tax=uncultured Gemmiger sp. TaxID=1623490 RepID=UPI0025FB9D2D|nr:ABC transporter ATP-binding protein [uncultured Gemmiger sp.]